MIFGCFRKKTFLLYVLSYLVIILMSFIFPLLHGSGDFSKLDSFVSQLFSFFVVYLLYVHYCNNNPKRENSFDFVTKIIVLAFIFQSIIILLSFFSIEIKSIVQLFQSATDAERSEKYLGARGLALSAAQFFPLSAAFVIAQVIFSYRILQEAKPKITTLSLMVLIMFAGSTAGRISWIGSTILLVSYLALIIKSQPMSCIKTLLIVIVLTVIMSIFVPSNLFLRFENYFQYAFEFFYNYTNYGIFETKSTNILNNMYWSLDTHTFIFGYGRYTESNGSTFMDTDAGFMRNMLLFGVVGSIFVVSSMLIKVFLLYKYIPEKKNIKSVFCILILGSLLILHYKGDTIAHLVSVQTILFFILISVLESSKTSSQKIYK